MDKVAVIGSGAVGEALANGFLKYGREVFRASRDPKKLEDWKRKAGGRSRIGTPRDGAAWADTIVLAIKGAAAVGALEAIGVENLKNKLVIDTTNPIANGAPEDGVLPFFTDHSQSLMERLQAKAADAKLVKAFSCVGSDFMVDPDFGGTRPTMFICGNDADAKLEVGRLLEQFGWETEDLGSAKAARAIEPLCMLWCLPGFVNNQWRHAFKLLR